MKTKLEVLKELVGCLYLAGVDWTVEYNPATNRVIISQENEFAPEEFFSITAWWTNLISEYHAE